MLNPQEWQETIHLLEITFQSEIASADAGALLFSPERNSGQLLLVFTGSIRTKSWCLSYYGWFENSG